MHAMTRPLYHAVTFILRKVDLPAILIVDLIKLSQCSPALTFSSFMPLPTLFKCQQINAVSVHVHAHDDHYLTSSKFI